MRGQEHLILEICVALSAALQRTEEKFSPLRPGAAADGEIDIEVFDDVLETLWRARVSLMSLADQCQKQMITNGTTSEATHKRDVN